MPPPQELRQASNHPKSTLCTSYLLSPPWQVAQANKLTDAQQFTQMSERLAGRRHIKNMWMVESQQMQAPSTGDTHCSAPGGCQHVGQVSLNDLIIQIYRK